MSGTNPTATNVAFLLLPAELRIAVYKDLLSNFTGTPSPLLCGALLSSSQLHSKLTYEMPPFFFANPTDVAQSNQTTWTTTFPLNPLVIICCGEYVQLLKGKCARQ
jgi:hypothetical protein